MTIQKRSTRHMIIAAVMTAVGVVLPLVLHAMPDGGKIFLPMHIPVMLAAFFLPWTWAAAVGVLTPVLSTLLTGMPALAPVPMAIIMPLELATYAIVISLLRKKAVSKDKWYSPTFAILPAMGAGRIVAGAVLFALVKIYLPMKISAWAFVWGSVVTGIPGIIIQIILLPVLYHVLVRSLKWYKR